MTYKKNPHFFLTHLSDIPYLLPYGQAIAGHRAGVRLDETGVMIWDLLDTFEEEKELSQAWTTQLRLSDGLSEEESVQAAEDLHSYLQMLVNHGILYRQNEKQNTGAEFSRMLPHHYYQIGTLLLDLHTDPVYLKEEFELFRIQTDETAVSDDSLSNTADCLMIPDLTVSILPVSDDTADVSKSHSGLPSSPTLLTSDLQIYDQDDHWLLFFPTNPGILSIHLAKSGKTAQIHVKQNMEGIHPRYISRKVPPFDDIMDELRYDLFHAIRLLYLYTAQKKGIFALHSVSILYKDRLWLFSGPSGMGKTTHTSLWQEEFGTEIFNGDLNLLSINSSKPEHINNNASWIYIDSRMNENGSLNDPVLVHGLPWNGTSGIYHNKTLSLGGIILLQKAPDNYLEDLTNDQKILYCSNRLISPTWTKKQTRQNLAFMEAVVQNVPVWRLHCTKEKEAAYFMKKTIDEHVASQRKIDVSPD